MSNDVRSIVSKLAWYKNDGRILSKKGKRFLNEKKVWEVIYLPHFSDVIFICFENVNFIRNKSGITNNVV